MASLDFASRTENFLHWFNHLPGSTFSDSIQIVDLRERNSGRGIVAVKDVPADTVLFTIPRTAIINTQTSKLRERIPTIFVDEKDHESAMEVDDGSQQDPWSSLILTMIFEHFQGDESEWKPYLDVLPTSFETPMFWTEAELEELQASPTRAKIGKESAEEMFRARVLPIIRKYDDVFPGSATSSDEELIALAHRMGSTVMSYAFDFDNEDEAEEDEEWVEEKEVKSTMGMVPMADILNADAEYNARVNYGDDHLTVTSLRSLKAGEEILNYYGPHPNSELLRRYGYVSSKHARYDVVEVPLADIEAAAVSHFGLSADQLQKVHEELDMDEVEDTFVLMREAEEPNADGTFAGPARIAEIPEDLQESIKALLKSIKKTIPSSIPDKRKRDEVQLTILVKTLDVMLSRYPTTPFQDARLLESDDIAQRNRMAVTVRLGEKRLLQEVKDYLAGALDKATTDGVDASNKRAKRSN